MRTVRPKPLAPALNTLPLTPEEGFVLSRIDGRLSTRDLVALTGIEPQRIDQIVDKLASHGAVALDDDAAQAAPSGDTASLADFAAALGMDPSAFGGQPVPRRTEGAPESRSSYPPPAMAADAITVEAPVVDLEQLEAAPMELEEVHDDEPAAELEEVHDDEPSETSEASAEEDESEEAIGNQRNYRQIYETRFHTLPTDARVHAAQLATGADLLALCFDAEPRVVAAVLDNPTSGLEHARLIALHHRTSTGLEMISRHAQLVRDSLVERRLLRNPQLGEVVLTRIMTPKNVFQTYKIAIDREIPELTRVKSRGTLRKKFQTSPSEDRADLVMRTEGRCLALLTGCTFDARTTSILCGKTFNSVLFIQNLAKFSATPPPLLAHLMKQPFVRKMAPLKKLLLQHPNMPGDVKRQH
ncbi:hypothetical protein AKJ09_01898 [Labilithrix luteola]|uniref:Uncharacterized protein n=1 Tax=Labilithrix luteola TaxID=1391654 RepID=A0A0K1PQ58_9BACT|nr:hypothetical protein [Labilithrix luteola]AKU95234.1 hypothetical protein AKJ09_01898 [Labilithrix luteola]